MEQFPIPDVLECMHFVLSMSQRNSRIVRNYEFDLYLGGEREIYINGVYYHISEGCLVFRKPGETVVGYGSYDMYMMTLDFSGSKINNLINYPASPRASIFLARAAKGFALINGRGYVTADDVKNVSMMVLRHSILLSYEAEAEGISSEDVITKIFNSVVVP
jgi:hypothetical protein